MKLTWSEVRVFFTSFIEFNVCMFMYEWSFTSHKCDVFITCNYFTSLTAICKTIKSKFINHFVY